MSTVTLFPAMAFAIVPTRSLFIEVFGRELLRQGSRAQTDVNVMPTERTLGDVGNPSHPAEVDLTAVAISFIQEIASCKYSCDSKGSSVGQTVSTPLTC